MQIISVSGKGYRDHAIIDVEQNAMPSSRKSIIFACIIFSYFIIIQIYKHK